MIIDHDKLESIARQLCNGSALGNGDYDAKGTKKAHWRDKAIVIMRRAEAEPAYKALFQACGWQL